MSVVGIARWLTHLELAKDFAGSSVVYPAVLATHMACIALIGGMILMTNLRLLGLAMTAFPVSEVVGRLRIVKRIGLVVMVGCGLLLAGSEATRYYPNPYFWTKLTLLGLLVIHAVVFRRTVYQNLAALDRAAVLPFPVKLAAASSLVLWLGVAVAGRMIGYYQTPPSSIVH